MLIEKYDVEVFTPPCEPGAERYAARARLTADISEILPYLNATLRGAIYYPSANALTWKKGGHNIAFHDYEMATSNVEDREGAEKELKGLIDLVNRTWERRAEITPDTSTRKTSHADGNIQITTEHQLQTVRRVDLLLVRVEAGCLAEKTCRLLAIG